MPDATWTELADGYPDPDAVVDWIAPDGTIVTGGTYHDPVIWLLPGEEPSPAHYTPTRWRIHEEEE